MTQPISIRLATGAFLASGLLAAGCASGDPGDTGSTDAAATASQRQLNCPRREADALNAKTLVGESLPGAQRLARRYGCYVRVVKRDGKVLDVTSDLVRNRINVVVDDGLVTRIHNVS